MAFKLSRRAVDDITHIYIDGAGTFGAAQAEKYHQQMETTFGLIASNPDIARERTEITPPVRIHPFGSHIIVYIKDGESDILILRVRHGSEDWKNNPSSL